MGSIIWSARIFRIVIFYSLSVYLIRYNKGHSDSLLSGKKKKKCLSWYESHAFPSSLLFILFNSPRTCLCHYQHTVLELSVVCVPVASQTKFLEGRDSAPWAHSYWRIPGTHCILTNFYGITLFQSWGSKCYLVCITILNKVTFQTQLKWSLCIYICMCVYIKFSKPDSSVYFQLIFTTIGF